MRNRKWSRSQELNLVHLINHIFWCFNWSYMIASLKWVNLLFEPELRAFRTANESLTFFPFYAFLDANVVWTEWIQWGINFISILVPCLHVVRVGFAGILEDPLADFGVLRQSVPVHHSNDVELGCISAHPRKVLRLFKRFTHQRICSYISAPRENPTWSGTYSFQQTLQK